MLGTEAALITGRSDTGEHVVACRSKAMQEGKRTDDGGASTAPKCERSLGAHDGAHGWEGAKTGAAGWIADGHEGERSEGAAAAGACGRGGRGARGLRAHAHDVERVGNEAGKGSSTACSERTLVQRGAFQPPHARHARTLRFPGRRKDRCNIQC